MAKCYNCGKVSSGSMPTVKIGRQERSYCADCYWRIEKEYKGKKNCEECSYFSNEKCKKKGKPLEPVTVGYSTYFVQAEKCGDFSTDKEIALAEIKKLEAKGQYEEAAAEYENWGMAEEAEKARKKMPAPSIDANALVKNLAKKGQTLTYYCCHCGAPLKIGAKAPQIQKTCPSCRGDLQVINLGKFIEQHSS
jgi:NAD-dependent SIR2 family protein deacetylase